MKFDRVPPFAQVTGGGAYKYSELIEKKLGVCITKEDEMQCMIRGCNFLLRNISGIVQYFFRLKSNPVILGGTGTWYIQGLKEENLDGFLDKKCE